jgi:predicted DNA-binding transcriptional regulator AlpA
MKANQKRAARPAEAGMRFLRKLDVAYRYGGVSTRTVDRMAEDGRIPPPAIFNGRIPLWSETELNEADEKAARELRARREVAPRPERRLSAG